MYAFASNEIGSVWIKGRDRDIRIELGSFLSLEILFFLLLLLLVRYIVHLTLTYIRPTLMTT